MRTVDEVGGHGYIDATTTTSASLADRGPGAWPAAHGGGRGVLHRHPYPGVDHDKSPAASRLGLLEKQLSHCMVQAATAGGQQADDKVRAASEASRLVRSRLPIHRDRKSSTTSLGRGRLVFKDTTPQI